MEEVVLAEAAASESVGIRAESRCEGVKRFDEGHPFTHESTNYMYGSSGQESLRTKCGGEPLIPKMLGSCLGFAN